MLTGDARESATHIAKLSKFLNDRSHIFTLDSHHIKEESLPHELSHIISQLSTLPSGAEPALVVEGHLIHECEQGSSMTLLVQVLKACKTVICYRATPKQKSHIVELARYRLKKRCLAIGDGANDGKLCHSMDL